MTNLWDLGLSDARAEWRDEAACKGEDPTLFFGDETERPGAQRRERIALAKTICARCTVRGACLISAFDHDERFGIWGGLTTDERRKLLRRRPTTG